jgi:hypothetical protein
MLQIKTYYQLRIRNFQLFKNSRSFNSQNNTQRTIKLIVRLFLLKINWKNLRISNNPLIKKAAMKIKIFLISYNCKLLRNSIMSQWSHLKMKVRFNKLLSLLAIWSSRNYKDLVNQEMIKLLNPTLSNIIALWRINLRWIVKEHLILGQKSKKMQSKRLR